MSKMNITLLAPLALGAALALGLQAPLAAQAANARPNTAETITYDAGLERTSFRPIVGAELAGEMKLTLYPNGSIQGTYFPYDGSPFPVAGGLQPNGHVFLSLGKTTVSGKLTSDGGIVGSTFGPPAFNALEFVAHPERIRHSQQRS